MNLRVALADHPGVSGTGSIKRSCAYWRTFGVRAGLTGHKTRSVFDRYDIVGEGDLRDAAERLDAATA